MQMRLLFSTILVFAAAMPAGAEMPRQASPEDAHLYFITPQDGATVSSPFRVSFGLRGMGIAPAGLNHPETGHHHLLINAPEVDFGMPLPTDDQVRHFGGGQTETEISLDPGTHTLQLLLGDYIHVPHDPPVMSERITITVK